MTTTVDQIGNSSTEELPDMSEVLEN